MIEGQLFDFSWPFFQKDSLLYHSYAYTARGAGFLFGKDRVAKWNETNNLNCISRAHQLVMEGYKYMFDQALVTVWSAPNYCYRCGNVAAILEVDDSMEHKFKKFDAAPADTRGLPVKRPQPVYFL